jgi:hypothetical protein
MSTEEWGKTASEVPPFLLTFLFPIFQLADSTGAPERRHGKDRHQNRVRDRKCDQPDDRMSLPLPPGRDQAVHRKQSEEDADGLLKELPSNTPERAQRHQHRAPKYRHYARVHAQILMCFFRFGHFCFSGPARRTKVRERRGRSEDFASARFASSSQRPPGASVCRPATGAVLYWRE